MTPDHHRRAGIAGAAARAKALSPERRREIAQQAAAARWARAELVKQGIRKMIDGDSVLEALEEPIIARGKIPKATKDAVRELIAERDRLLARLAAATAEIEALKAKQEGRQT